VPGLDVSNKGPGGRRRKSTCGVPPIPSRKGRQEGTGGSGGERVDICDLSGGRLEFSKKETKRGLKVKGYVSKSLIARSQPNVKKPKLWGKVGK